MFPFTDNATVNPALPAQLAAQVGLVASLSQRSVDLFARLSELNLQLTRRALDTTLETGRALLACTDAAQLASTAMHGWQPLGEHVRTYQEGLMGVLATSQADTRTDLDKAAAQMPVGAMFANAGAPDGAAGPSRRAH